MQMKNLFLLLFTMTSIFSYGQKNTVTYKFHSFNSISFLNGDNEVSAGLQSINGFQIGSWFGGVGVGLDYYIHRSVPLFADFRYEYGKNKNKFYAYADGGVNFAWVERYYNGNIYIFDGVNNSNKFNNGVYTDAGLGYLVDMKKGGALVLSLGHTHKSMTEIVKYRDWRTQQWQEDIYRYKFNRIAIKVGWRF